MKKNNILAVTLSAGLLLGGAYLVEANQNVAYAQENLSIDVEIPRKESQIDGLKKEMAQKNDEISNLENQKEDQSQVKAEIQENIDNFNVIYDEYKKKYDAWENAKKDYNEKNNKLQDLEKQIEDLKNKIASGNFKPEDLDKMLAIDSKAAPLRFEVRDAKADMEEKLAEVKKLEPDFKEAKKNYNQKSKELNDKLDDIDAHNKEIDEKIEKVNKEKADISEKIKNLEEEISQIKKNREIVREILGDEADVIGYNYRSVETTKDSDKKEEMGITAETRAKLLEAIKQAEIKIDAVRFLKENTPKTIAKVVDKLDKLVAEQEILIKEAKELLAKY